MVKCYVQTIEGDIIKLLTGYGSMISGKSIC